MENEVLVTTEKKGMPLWLKGTIAVATVGVSLAVAFGIRAYRKRHASKPVAEQESHEE